MNISNDEMSPVELLAEEFLERQQRGEKPTIKEYQDKHPELAAEIQDLFEGFMVIENLKPGSADLLRGRLDHRGNGEVLENIGGYRIIREIGRGGMGVVYEAEQESLRRRVALKVLPRQHANDTKSVKRFQQEARAAGRMHHTNIVPVFEVGQDCDRIFYAMQLIRGQGLELVIEDLKRMRNDSAILKRAAEPGESDDGTNHEIAASLITGCFRQEGWDTDVTEDGQSGSSNRDSAALFKEAETVAQTSQPTMPVVLPGQSDITSAESNRSSYFDSVAQIGMQTADALSYSHARGIIHRDIKPSNLLLDATGTVWVTDFGLAKTSDEGMTHTGDILGTLRYMSPERFRGECDGRSDVYALGLTLYELLILKPAFESSDRLKLIELVKQKDPVAPRVIDPTIPRDLETIVLKTVAKEPRHRYQSADALADDLQRFLHDEPIHARRASLVERMARWSRHNKVLASSIGIVGCLTLIVTFAALFAAGYFREIANEKNRLFNLAKQQVVKLALSNAKRFADKRDIKRELHWLVSAAENDLDRFSSKESLPTIAEENHRLRIAATIEKLNARLEGLCLHDRPVIHADCDPAGAKVVTIVGDEKAYVWDSSRAALAYPPFDHSARVTSAEFSLAGDLIVTASEDGKINVRNSVNGALLKTIKTNSPVRRATFSPNGSAVAAVTRSNLFRWSVATGEPIADPIPVEGDLIDCGFSPDGKSIVTQTDGPDGKARVWNCETNEALSPQIPAPRFKQQAAYDFAIIDCFELRRWPVFRNDSQALAVGDGYSIQFWSRADGLKEFRTALDGKIKQIDPQFSPSNPNYLYYSQRRDWGLHRLDLRTGRSVKLADTSRLSTGLRISPDGRLAAMTISGGDTTLVRLSKGKLVATLPANTDLNQFRFTPDSRRIMTASNDGAVRIFSLPVAGSRFEPYGFDCGRADRFVSRSRVFNSNGKWQAERAGGSIRGVNKHNTQEIELPGTAGAMPWRFTPNRDILIVRTASGGLQAWQVNDTPTMTELKRDEEGYINRLRGLALYDAESGESLATLPPVDFKLLPAHGSYIPAWFSKDGSRVGFMSDLGKAHVWKLPRFTSPLSQVAPLAELLTGLKRDSHDGIVTLSHDEFFGRTEEFITAFRVWKGLSPFEK